MAGRQEKRMDGDKGGLPCAGQTRRASAGDDGSYRSPSVDAAHKQAPAILRRQGEGTREGRAEARAPRARPRRRWERRRVHPDHLKVTLDVLEGAAAVSAGDEVNAGGKGATCPRPRPTAPHVGLRVRQTAYSSLYGALLTSCTPRSDPYRHPRPDRRDEGRFHGDRRDDRGGRGGSRRDDYEHRGYRDDRDFGGPRGGRGRGWDEDDSRDWKRGRYEVCVRRTVDSISSD